MSILPNSLLIHIFLLALALVAEPLGCLVAQDLDEHAAQLASKPVEKTLGDQTQLGIDIEAGRDFGAMS